MLIMPSSKLLPSITSVLLLASFAGSAIVSAQSPAQTASAKKIIIDTDIGDDIDDAFAIDLSLISPEVHILGISAAWGDTALRARMLDRLTCELGMTGVPIQAGPTTVAKSTFSQKPWAEQGIERPHGDAVAFLLDQIRQYPGQITLLALGPLTNVAAAIDRDPATFRKLQRVVMMGGSIHRGYDHADGTTTEKPDAEYNLASDPAAAQKLFRSGVPIFLMPLDSTQLKFDQSKRDQLNTLSTPTTDTLQVLIGEWQHSTKQTNPTLFDPVAAAYAIDSTTCPTTPLHIEVDEKGFTRATPGAPNAEACLEPHPEVFFHLFMPRLLGQRLAGRQVCTRLSRQ